MNCNQCGLGVKEKIGSFSVDREGYVKLNVDRFGSLEKKNINLLICQRCNHVELIGGEDLVKTIKNTIRQSYKISNENDNMQHI